jgi:hypothetical protein
MRLAIGADDEQHESRDQQENLQPLPILGAHAHDTRASRAEVKRLTLERGALVRAHLSPVRTQPLLELDAHLGLDRARRRTRLDAADELEPVRVGFVEIGVGLEQGLDIQG